jgi:hypothetical protein
MAKDAAGVSAPQQQKELVVNEPRVEVVAYEVSCLPADQKRSETWSQRYCGGDD